MKLVSATISICWMPRLDLADRGDAVLHRHDEVHEDDVRPAGLRQSNGLLAVGRVTDDLHVVHDLEQSAQPAANDGVVVDDEDADRLGVGHLATPCAAPAVAHAASGPARGARTCASEATSVLAGARARQEPIGRTPQAYDICRIGSPQEEERHSPRPGDELRASRRGILVAGEPTVHEEIRQ